MKVQSGELNVFLARLNAIHRVHGLTILSESPKLRWQKIWTTLAWSATIALDVLLLAGTVPSLTSNDKFQRLMCLTCLIINLQVCSQELLFASKREKVLELVDWCHYVEMQQLESLKRPAGWYLDVRKRLTHLIE